MRTRHTGRADIGRQRGFTLVELLVAMVITVFIVGAALTVALSARASFAADPGALDTGRRMREGVASLTAALRSAGGDVGVGALAAGVPPVWPLTALDGSTDGPRFEALWVLRAEGTAAGRLSAPQPDPTASLTLEEGGACPATPGVCGLSDGDTALVFDARGRFDVFEVGIVSPALRRVTPAAPLGRAYAAGAHVLAVRADRYGLVAQADGSRTLTRVTWAGATQPMVDGVVLLEIDVWGEAAAPVLADGGTGPGLASYGLAPPPPDDEDPDGMWPEGEHCMAARPGGVPVSRLAPLGAGGLVRLHPADLDDGPWCEGEWSATPFDADLFRVRRIDLRLRVEAQAAMLRGSAGTLFARGGTAVASPLRWVPDREMTVSVAIPRR